MVEDLGLLDPKSQPYKVSERPEPRDGVKTSFFLNLVGDSRFGQILQKGFAGKGFWGFCPVLESSER